MTLFLYILREYAKYVFGTIVLTLFMFTLFDFIHKTTSYFSQYEAETKHIVMFYLFQMPGQMQQALPIAALLASVIAMVLLSRTNEITAMRASGMGPLKVGMPLAFGGLMLTLVSVLLGEFVIPRMAEKMHYVQQVLIEKDSEEELAQGARWVRNGSTMINFKDYDTVTQQLSGLKIVEVRPNFRPKQTIEAAVAEYVAEEKTWAMDEIKITYFHRNGTVERVEKKRDQKFSMPIEPKKLRKERRKSNELSTRELREKMRRGDSSGADTTAYKVDFHMKWAYPFAAFVVSLIGLKFGYRSERATETAKGVLFALMIGIGYWFFLSAGRALGNRGSLHPFLAAWMANVVVLALILWDSWRARVKA
jgi:lipopolysaccharide export system permease protein